MRICCISDTHTKHDAVMIPECDLLISAGDYSWTGTDKEIRDFHFWLDQQPARHIISMQGNHELGVEKNFDFAKALALGACRRLSFIEEGPLEIKGVKIWCSAITPFFCNWAYNRERGAEINKHWDRIPLDTEVLVTHGPPKGILDRARYDHVGCTNLLAKIQELKNLKLHVFGHIHSGRGRTKINDTTFINATICNERYEPIHIPQLFDIELITAL